MLKALQVVFIIVGTIIGAGFISGKEIAIYFSNYGYLSLIYLIIFFFIFYYSIHLLLNKSFNCEYKNIYDINKQILNSKIFNIFCSISFIIVSSAMFSAFKELFNNCSPLIYL